MWNTLYDFENDKINDKGINSFAKNQDVNSERILAMHYFTEDNKYNYLLGYRLNEKDELKFIYKLINLLQ